jgi:hypothetical protein
MAAGGEAGGVELFGSSGAKRSGGSSTGTVRPPSASGARSAGAGVAGGVGLGGGGGAGEAGDMTVSSALKQALEHDAAHFRWVAAVSGSQTAATLELGTGGEPVMAIGGFNNEGGNLSLTQFEAYVEKGEIHYYMASGNAGAGLGGGGGLPGGGAAPGGGPGGAASSSAIADWVKANFKAVTIGNETVYDLTQARS